MQCRAIAIVGMLVAGTVFCGAGCTLVGVEEVVPPVAGTPRELEKAILPPYIIEPPDVLVVEAIHIVPRPPYHLRTFDVLVLHVEGALSEAPIDGPFAVEPGGFIKLGTNYGSVKVAGMTLDEAEKAIETHLCDFLREPKVSASLAETAGKQQISGEHLVGPDGTITLGSYGSVRVVGMTLDKAKEAIEIHLSDRLEEPEISLNIFGYNSKVYYVITQGAGTGDRVFRFPITGNETVLDAISQVNGLEHVSSKRIWIARAGPDCNGCDQVLPIDWDAITQSGNVQTNYQVLPGDRVYISEDRLVALDTHLGKIFAPMERILGFTLLGTGAVTRLSGPVLRGGGNRTNNF